MKRTFLVFAALLLMVSMLGAVALAEDHTATPPPSASGATIEEAVEQFLKDEMARQARLAEDGWQRFIYAQGVDEITMNLEKFDIEKGKPLTVNFLLASGQPDVKTLGKYEGDPDTWLESMQKAMLEHDTKGKTTLTIEKTGATYTASFATKAETALQKSVESLAKKAPTTFSGSKVILQAITDYLIPTPIAVPSKKPTSLQDEHQPAFTAYLERNSLSLEEDQFIGASLYALKGYKLDTKGGPEDFVLTYTAPDLAALVDAAAATLSKRLAYDEKAKAYTEKELEVMLAEELGREAATHRHGKDKGESNSYTFSILSLPKNLNHLQFHASATQDLAESMGNSLLGVQVNVLFLPDYPAIENPKSGLMAGEKKGSNKIVFDASKDADYAHYERIFDENDNLVMAFFVNPKERATIYLPQGTYRWESSQGEIWYGEDHRFGPHGGYTESPLEVKKLAQGYYSIIRYNMSEFKGSWKPIDTTPLDYDSLLPGD